MTRSDGGVRDDALIVLRDGPVETLVIDDAPRNRMGLAFMDALEAEVERLAGDPGVRAVVIRGAGDENFSVGMDLKQLPEGVKRMGSVEAVFDQRLRVLSAIENLGKPVVATLYGYCLGGGLELPLACHFLVLIVRYRTTPWRIIGTVVIGAYGGLAIFAALVWGSSPA